MDEISPHIPPEGLPKRLRTTSLAPNISGVEVLHPYPSAASRFPLALRHRASAASVSSNFSAASDRGEIISPIPRRHHLLQTSGSSQLQWMQTPPQSPVTLPSHSPRHSHSSLPHDPPLSFSALLEHETPTGPSTVTFRVEQGETSAGKRLVRWLHKSGMKDWVTPLAIAAAVCVKWAISLGSYSGEKKSPLYGDYEAQRHWMELTLHLPPSLWYTYDLQYWGLDYPPLTAYVSWICGLIGSWIDPTWFAFYSSRGIETPGSKVYMRSTVLLLDTLVYVPALVLFMKAWQESRSKRTQNLALLTMLFQPALLLVDFGHFQYNSVMLGLTLLAVNLFAMGRDELGAVCFVLSLGFKQMALYFAPAIGAYLLGKCLYLGPSRGTQLFLRLGATTLLTFFLLFLPFLPPYAPFSAMSHPITRIFPFDRGLFEDKVANFWFASNVMIKWRLLFDRGALVKLSALMTAVGFTPAVVGLIGGGLRARPSVGKRTTAESAADAPTPTLPLLPYALLTSSLSFFLFSFQVHEKTIVLPLLPMTMLLSGATIGSSVHKWGVLVNNIAVFSMWPLLKRDGQGVQYIAMLLLWNRLVGYNPLRVRSRGFVDFLSIAVYAAATAVHVLELLVPPPARYQDLFPVLNVLVSAPVFALVWLWSIKGGVEVSWALAGLGASVPPPAHAADDGSPRTRRMRVTSTPSSGGTSESGGVRAGREGLRRRSGGERAVSLGYAQSGRVGVSRRAAASATARPSSALGVSEP